MSLVPISLGLLTTQSLLIPMIISRRGARAVPWVFRQKLPQTRIDLSKLPPLTNLLTSDEHYKAIEDAASLRRKKLQVYKSYMPVNSNTTLIESLFDPESNCINNLLQVIDNNLETMTSFYIGVCFEVLDDFIRAKLCDAATVAVSPEFKRLSVKALYKMRFFEADEVLKLVKCLSTVGVPKNSLIYQSSLKMARASINDFEPDELRILADATGDSLISQVYALRIDSGVKLED